MPPGPGLAAVLAGIDRATLSDDDLLTVLAARCRQVAHEQAQVLADLLEVAGRAPYPEFAADEVAACLTWTRRAAETQVGLADDLLRRLPTVGQALDAGAIDLPKARVIADAVMPLPQEAARQVARQILDLAPELTTGQLRAKLARLVLAADPQAGAIARQRAEADRRVVLTAEPDGTASLAGYGLPAARATAAAHHIHTLATAAKAAGDMRSLDQLRADTLLDLLTGTAPPTGRAATAETGRGSTIELTIGLATLAGLDEQPGDLAGYGPVAADSARQIAATHPQATWRYTVYDPTNRTRYHGTTRRRPTPTVAAEVTARDRTCRAPGCRTPARRCDLDHTHPWQHGGVTQAHNLGALCRHHHRMKDTGGWKLRQLAPGVFGWHSPLGRSYLVGPDPP